jgi:molybdenum cofactor synthesis domain-containing protein
MTDAPTTEHPMMAVPTAVRIVVSETCRQMERQTRVEELVIHGEEEDPNLWQQLYCRISEEDVTMCPPGYPPYTASVMDGYAIQLDESEHTNDDATPWTHILREKIFAGISNETTTAAVAIPESINDDEDDIQSTTSSKMQFNDYSQLPAAYYVTTGAMIPNHCDCVVPIEEVRLQVEGSTTLLSIPWSSRVRNKWIRRPGCDIPAGTVLVERKTRLDPIAIGLLLQSGVSSVKVRRKVTIGILSTGSELQTSAERSVSGMIPDINRPVLLSLFHSNPHLDVLDFQIVRDDDPMEDMVRVFSSAVERCDIVVSTGGISKGETDFVEGILMQQLKTSSSQLPQLHFGRLHMKPGKPTTFITMPKPDPTQGKCLWFALPGNPVSAYVCAQLLVWPCVHLLAHGVEVPECMDNGF